MSAITSLEDCFAYDSALVFGVGGSGDVLARGDEPGVRSPVTDGIGLVALEELETLLEIVETEASRIPVEAARGEFGPRTIRGGEVSLRTTPASAVTFYLDPTAVAATSSIADCVRGSDTLEEATEALRDAGLQMEFETERRRLEST
ncbi:DUF1152 domain-containing protein [Natrialbaceae archaeon AArc-T1-2]|uniref:DUF1152 domain-containing protein n=1 Tax=Natrialbaceae archaeon AArc-T1-2 TaxID=3053904 RepID=UPI00255B0169|nr:DUF1152 domain-containing protein [Natrialbaceae archaeon AArc-T1-2]WIV66351.1 DUF1152 domain-containing protein [Natrialbaceae archaeon AArc-T1-2]